MSVEAISPPAVDPPLPRLLPEEVVGQDRTFRSSPAYPEHRSKRTAVTTTSAPAPTGSSVSFDPNDLLAEGRHATGRLPAVANPGCPHTMPGQLFEYGQGVVVNLFTVALVVDHVSDFIVAWEVERLGGSERASDVHRLIDSAFAPRIDALNGRKRIGGGPCDSVVVTPGTPTTKLDNDSRFSTHTGSTPDSCTTSAVESALGRVAAETKIIMAEPGGFEPRAMQELREPSIRLAPQIRFFGLALAHAVWRANYVTTPGELTSAFERLTR